MGDERVDEMDHERGGLPVAPMDLQKAGLMAAAMEPTRAV